MNFIEELERRGMLHDMTPGVKEFLEKEKVTGYIGFDPTAPSLTIGNLVQIQILTLFQKHGHSPIVLMGGATGRIGDPSFKDKERELKTVEELDRNLMFQIEQMKKLLKFEGVPNKAILFNNFDIYHKMNVLDFLRDVGKTLTVSYMMSKDSVKNRLETGLSFTEFTYQVLQGYDFQHLYTTYNCKLQMGGSDQWGNITSGTEFIRRNLDQKAYAVTTPLLTKSDGTKFGKSESGNIWLDPELTSPYKFYQFWLNAADEDIAKLFKYFSLREIEEIENLLADLKEMPNQLKKILAIELTERIHSKDAMEAAQRVSELLFNPKADHDYLRSLSESELKTISEEIPSSTISTKEAELADMLCDQSGIFTSKGEFRRAVQNNAISVNKIKVTDHQHRILASDWLHDKYLMIENGKKNKYLLALS